MSYEVKAYLTGMVVAGVLACIPPGDLVLVAISALFAGMALLKNFVDKGGLA